MHKKFTLLIQEQTEKTWNQNNKQPLWTEQNLVESYVQTEEIPKEQTKK